MELILKETISSLGREGDVITVKSGYGRNYLLPQGKALPRFKLILLDLELNFWILVFWIPKQPPHPELVFQIQPRL